MCIDAPESIANSRSSDFFSGDSRRFPSVSSSLHTSTALEHDLDESYGSDIEDETSLLFFDFVLRSFLEFFSRIFT